MEKVEFRCPECRGALIWSFKGSIEAAEEAEEKGEVVCGFCGIRKEKEVEKGVEKEVEKAFWRALGRRVRKEVEILTANGKQFEFAVYWDNGASEGGVEAVPRGTAEQHIGGSFATVVERYDSYVKACEVLAILYKARP